MRPATIRPARTQHQKAFEPEQGQKGDLAVRRGLRCCGVPVSKCSSSCLMWTDLSRPLSDIVLHLKGKGAQDHIQKFEFSDLCVNRRFIVL